MIESKQSQFTYRKMIRLLGDKIAVAPISDPNTSEGKPSYSAEEIAVMKARGDWDESFLNRSGSLIIPDEAKERADQGIVKYVGPRVKHVKIGDYVLFSGYTGTVVQFAKDADGALIIFREPFVTAILDNPDTDVIGLYFRSKLNYDKLKQELQEIIGDLGHTTEQKAERCIECFGFHDPYFTATYEMAMNLIAQAFRDTSFAKTTGFKNPLDAKPQPHEYDIMNELLEEDAEDVTADEVVGEADDIRVSRR